MEWYPFFLLSLAVWRVSSLFAREDGPFDIFIRFRGLVGVQNLGTDHESGTNWFNKGLICPWCSSVWISLVVALFYVQTAEEYFILALALSSASIMVDSFVTR